MSRSTAASCPPTSACAPASTASTPWATSCPGSRLAHRGFAQGIFVAEEIAGLAPAPIDETGIPRVTYCDPEIASVGLTEAQAREKHGDVATYEYNLGGNGKSQILGTQGFVKARAPGRRARRRRPHDRGPDG